MKKVLFSLLLTICTLSVMAQGMTDSQVADFIKREVKAGTSQAQIVTKLVQRGVPIDQIRRVRNQYNKQTTEDDVNTASDETIKNTDNRTRTNNDGNTYQELSTGKTGTTGEVVNNANSDIQNVEDDIQMMSNVNEGTGKKVFGRDIFNNRLLTFEPTMNIATPQNYTVGPGDQVVVDVYGASQESMSLTVSPDGRMDSASSPEVDSRIRAEADGIMALILDLEHVEYVSSGGLRVILSWQQEMENRGGSMKVLHVNEYIMEVFDLTGFINILTIE